MKVREFKQDFSCRHLAKATRHTSLSTHAFDLFLAHFNGLLFDSSHLKSIYVSFCMENIFPFSTIALCNIFYFREGASNKSSFLF